MTFKYIITPENKLSQTADYIEPPYNKVLGGLGIDLPLKRNVLGRILAEAIQQCDCDAIGLDEKGYFSWYKIQGLSLHSDREILDELINCGFVAGATKKEFVSLNTFQ